MRVYRCRLPVTDSQGRTWDFEETYTRWQSGGELADRRALAETFAGGCAMGMQREGIFLGSTIGQMTIELIEQRQPTWEEMGVAPVYRTPELRLVKS